MAEDLILQMEADEDMVLVSDDGINLADDTVTAEAVLRGYTFHLPNGQKAEGACMYDSSTYDATATDADIVSGKTAYAGGGKITGTYTLAGHTSATATAADIKRTKTAWVNGSKLTGTYIPHAVSGNKVTQIKTMTLYVPAGQHNANVAVQVPYNNAIDVCVASFTSLSGTSTVTVKNPSGSNIQTTGYTVSPSMVTFTPRYSFTNTEYTYTVTITTTGYYYGSFIPLTVI